MKRFHIHVAVADLTASTRFYSHLFGAEPAVRKPDYAKWMLDDPRVNFAISARGRKVGIDHLGVQVDSTDELAVLHAQIASAGSAPLMQKGTTCCYAQSDKYWLTDPSGIAWESFHTSSDVALFGEDTTAETTNLNACCGPQATETKAGGCGPTAGAPASGCC